MSLLTLPTIPPQLFLLLAAGVWALMPKAGRSAMVLIVPTVVLALVWFIPLGAEMSWDGVAVEELTFYRNDEIARLFGTIFALALGGTLLYGWQIARPSEQVATLFYASAAFGVIYTGNLINLFIAWEMLALGGLGVLWSSNNEKSHAAGLRYFLVHALGGVLLMIGITSHLANGGALALEAITPDRWYHWCMFAGLVINTAAPPLWSWVADAYPSASVNGTVVLACFTTKSAVFVLIKIFPGIDILIPLGLAMIAYGAIFSAMESNTRRTLAYSLVGQVGFMVVCVGIGTPLALLAASLHAFSHITYKTLLLMTAGCVTHVSGKEHLYELGGYWKSGQLRDIALCALVGGLALAALPFTCGFVSKSVIMASVTEAEELGIWLYFMLAAGAALIYVGLRFPYFAFFADGPAPVERPLPITMRLGVYGCTGLAVSLAISPLLLKYALSDVPTLHIYTLDHVLTQIQMLLAASMLFLLMRNHLKPKPGHLVDIDSLYLWPIRGARKRAPLLANSLNVFTGFIGSSVFALFGFLERPHRPDGILARTWSAGTMALWVAITLAILLLLFLG